MDPCVDHITQVALKTHPLAEGFLFTFLGDRMACRSFTSDRSEVMRLSSMGRGLLRFKQGGI